MAISLPLRRRLSPAQTTPSTSMPTNPIQHTPDPYGLTHAQELRDLRRSLEDAWSNWQQCDAENEAACWYEVQAADARIQALVARAQREMATS